MELQLAALKTATLETNARARTYLARNRLDAAECSYDTLLHTLTTLLKPEAETARGWQRAALTLADIERRIGLDALAPSRMGALQLRLAALLDLPDVLTVATIGDVQRMLTAAINAGAPRYNTGDVCGCCIVYWSTALALHAAAALRGFPGYARIQAQLRAVTEADVSPLPLDSRGTDDLAWALRHAFDAILGMTS